MRVLQFGPFPPPWGGVQTNIVAIRDFMRAHGADSDVINTTRHRKQDGNGIHYPKSAAALIKLLFTLDYDVVHIHVGGTMPRRVLSLMLACTGVPGKPSVMSFHSGGFPTSPEAIAAVPRSYMGFVLRRFDALVGVNPQILDFFRKMDVREERLHLVYPHAFGPDVARIARQERHALPDQLRAFFAAHDETLVTVGLLEPEYDLALQIEALGAIRARHPNAGLVIIGSGSLEADLRARIDAAPWREHVLLCGDVPRESTLLAIAKADVVLRTTLYDGDAISVREALHVGAPVIASDNGMRPTGVRLVPKQDLSALVDMVDGTLAETRGVPREIAADGEQNLEAVVRIYERLTGKSVLARHATARREALAVG